MKINGEEIDTIKICGAFSFLFNETIKRCSYSIDNKKHWIKFEITLIESLKREELNIITITLNQKIEKLQGELSYFFRQGNNLVRRIM